MSIFNNIDFFENKSISNNIDMLEFLDDDFELIEREIDKSDIEINRHIKDICTLYNFKLDNIDFENIEVKDLFQDLFDISEDQVSLEGLMSFAKAGVDKIIHFANRTWFFLKNYYLKTVSDFKKSEIQLNELEHKLSKADLDNDRFLSKKIKFIMKKDFLEGLKIYVEILSKTDNIMSISAFDKDVSSRLHIESIKDSYNAIYKAVENGGDTKKLKDDLAKSFSDFLDDILKIINSIIKPRDYEYYLGLKVREGTSATTSDVLQFSVPKMFKIIHGSASVNGLGYNESSFSELKKLLIDAYPNYNAIKKVYDDLEKDYKELAKVASMASKLSREGNTKVSNLIVRYLLYKKMTMDAKKMLISKPISNLKRLTKKLLKLGYIQLKIINKE